jgi:hypothetical protein
MLAARPRQWGVTLLYGIEPTPREGSSAGRRTEHGRQAGQTSSGTEPYRRANLNQPPRQTPADTIQPMSPRCC